MQIPLEITFDNLERSPAMEARVRDLVTQLEKVGPQIIRCHVTIEAPHKHHRQGNLFHVSLRITVPGREIAVSHDHQADHAREDPYVALRDAFRAARRQLQDHVREQRGDVKTHVEQPHGRISELDRERSCGRIETSDGRMIYFHRNSVLGGSFDKLDIGTRVRFVEESGEQGPQASTVHV